MAQKKRTGLGKGFDSLIPKHIVESEFDPTAETEKSISRTRNVLITDVQPNPEQPRSSFNEEQLAELAASIKVHGIIQPIIVTEFGDGYQIIAGERRWRAAKLAGQETVPVIVRSLNDQSKMELALIENIQREELNAIEAATAYLKLYDQFNIDYGQIGKRVGKSASTINNIVRLLGLGKKSKRALIDGVITEGHARQLLALKELKEEEQLLDLIIRNGWSVRKAEQYVQAMKQDGKDKEKAVTKTTEETPETKSLSKKLNTTVTLQRMAKGGRLQIRYKDDQDLSRILKKLD